MDKLTQASRVLYEREILVQKTKINTLEAQISSYNKPIVADYPNLFVWEETLNRALQIIRNSVRKWDSDLVSLYVRTGPALQQALEIITKSEPTNSSFYTYDQSRKTIEGYSYGAVKTIIRSFTVMEQFDCLPTADQIRVMMIEHLEEYFKDMMYIWNSPLYEITINGVSLLEAEDIIRNVKRVLKKLNRGFMRRYELYMSLSLPCGYHEAYNECGVLTLRRSKDTISREWWRQIVSEYLRTAGDESWTCADCGELHWENDTECIECGEPRVDEEEDTDT